MGSYENIGIRFDEEMSGWIGVGYDTPIDGRVAGELNKTPFDMKSKITIPSLSKFIDRQDHTAQLEGTVTYAPLGKNIPIQNGMFNLFRLDPNTGRRHMNYAFNLTGSDGRIYFVYGHKDIQDDPGFDILKDMTTLFTTIFEGANDQGKIFGSGQLFFNLLNTGNLVASMEVTGDAWWGKRLAAKTAFISFAYGALRDEYLSKFSLLYNSGYQNLVLAGKAIPSSGGPPREFFFISGAHDEGFPWGDGEEFSDVLLVVSDGSDSWRRFGITRHALNSMMIDVRAGQYTFTGDIYEIVNGNSVSLKELANNATTAQKYEASFTINFKANPLPLTPLPFQILGDNLDKLSYSIRKTLHKLLPSEALLGIHIIPHDVSLTSGHIKIDTPEPIDLELDCSKTFGEAEVSTIKNVKEPTLLYGYICGVRPEEKSARVQIHSSTFRNERAYWLKDQLDEIIGAVVSHLGHVEYLVQPNKLTVKNLEETEQGPVSQDELFESLEIVLELVNDNYPTADFIRRIIKVRDPSGATCLALEEDMDGIRTEALNPQPGMEKVKVASIRGDDKFAILDEALDSSDFFETLENKYQAWKKLPENEAKQKSDFHVVIKPNFMFTYNKADPTTFTDPELVEALVETIRQRDFTRVTLVEAQSTYGEYFNRRSVREVAEYIGYSLDGSKGYEVVDLTVEAQKDQIYDQFGPRLGRHLISKTWRDADFRISFAKNKTHCYAYYTLTLKNIYGSLPLADKFKEYHCERDIYYTTIEHLEKYPVDFGIIDAVLSADGPFGIFADSEPNKTKTVIAGANLVAVDWIGASKMGLDPKISKFMDLAVRTFGKPEIDLIGDRRLYRPWLNVPKALALFTNFGLDADFDIGNVFYLVGCYMDESHFTHKSRSHFIHAARDAIEPIQEMVFLQAGGERTRANRIFSKFLTWLGR